MKNRKENIKSLLARVEKLLREAEQEARWAGESAEAGEVHLLNANAKLQASNLVFGQIQSIMKEMPNE